MRKAKYMPFRIEPEDQTEEERMLGSKSSGKARARLLAVCIAVMCAAVLGLAGCGSSGGSSSAGSASSAASGSSASANASADQGMRQFTDSAGRTVDVPATIDRVAVTGPVSQMAMLTFAPEKMVGLSNELSETEMKYVGEEYGKLPVYGQIYGGKGDFNKEAVANANPQVIIDLGEAKKSIVEDMDEVQNSIGIPCVHIEATYSTYDQAYQMLGELLNKEDRAEELATYCKTSYDTTKAGLDKVAADARVKVAYLLGDAGLNAMAKGSFQATVVDEVADNVVEIDNAGGSGLGSEVSFEQIALWDPQMIIFAPASVYGKVGSDESWATLSAVKDGKFFEVPGEPYNWISSPPGINQVLGFQWFARLCYPDQFDDSMAEIVTNYYKTVYGYDLSEDECTALLAHAGAAK